MLKNASILLVFLVPAALIVLIKVCPAKLQPVSEEPVISESEARRIEAKERRAEREEARKEKRAIRQAQEKEQRSLEDSDRWFAENERFERNGNDGQFGFEEPPAPGMMPLPMPPVLPNIAYGSMRGGRGFEGGTGFDDFGYAPDAGFDGYDANGFGDDFGNGFRRF